MFNKQYNKLGAALTVGFMFGASDSAFAAAASATGGTTTTTTTTGGNNFSNIASNIAGSIGSLPGLISAVAYLFGVLIGVLGILKIKDHVENPTQTPLKDGAIRLAAGGALFALPIVFEAMLNTIGKSESVDVAKLKKVKLGLTTP